jgi:hypothetical protein
MPHKFLSDNLHQGLRAFYIKSNNILHGRLQPWAMAQAAGIPCCTGTRVFRLQRLPKQGFGCQGIIEHVCVPGALPRSQTYIDHCILVHEKLLIVLWPRLAVLLLCYTIAPLHVLVRAHWVGLTSERDTVAFNDITPLLPVKQVCEAGLFGPKMWTHMLFPVRNSARTLSAMQPHREVERQ